MLSNSDLPKLIELLNQIDIRVQVRRHTAAEWAANDEVLLPGEWGKVIDTGVMKQGDGVTAFSGLMPVPGILVDPSADRLLFWDASAGKYQFLQLGAGLSILGTTLSSSAGGGTADPHTQAFKHDEFEDWSTSGWSASVGSSGVVSQYTTVIFPGRPGVVRLHTGGVSTGTATILDSGTAYLVLGGGAYWEEFDFYLPILSTSGERYTLSIGLRDVGATSTSNELVLSYSDNLNGGNWVLRSVIGGVLTDINTPTTGPAAATWYRLRIEVNAAGTSAEFFINGASIGTTTLIPTVAQRRAAVISKAVGSGVRELLVDYSTYSLAFTTPR